MVTEGEWELLLSLITAGLTDKDACSASGISRETFYKRVREESDFSDTVKKAQVKFKLKHLKNITDAAGNGNWQASAWILERKFKREYSKVEYQEQLRDEFAGKSDEELNEMLQQLEEDEREYELRNKKSEDSTGKEEDKGEE